MIDRRPNTPKLPVDTSGDPTTDSATYEAQARELLPDTLRPHDTSYASVLLQLAILSELRALRAALTKK